MSGGDGGSGSSAPNTSKMYATETRTGKLETRVGTITSQRGTTSGFSHLSQTQSGTVEQGGVPQSNAVTEFANVTSPGQTGGPNSGSFAGHTHDYGGHNHGMNHFHFTQVAPDYNTLVDSLNQMRQALINAGIL
jgi:hypothetical protein